MNRRRSVRARRVVSSRLLRVAGLLAIAAGLLLGIQTASASSGASGPSTKLTGSSGYNEPLCESGSSLCADTYDNPGDEYVGHDEPSLEFKSSEPGSGNDMTYTLRLPKEPAEKPKNDGSGGTWNFELRPTFWFGLTLCDSESAPEFTKTCTPDSDANDLVGSNPAAPDYIGKHPGNAFMELQFYGPGYVPQFEGFGCAAHRYCAAMTIDSLNQDQNTGVANTAACDNYILGGIEPINWAYITKSGVSQAPADPLFTGTFDNPNLSAVTPEFNRDLMMNPGDRITIHLHDTPAGFRGLDWPKIRPGCRDLGFPIVAPVTLIVPFMSREFVALATDRRITWQIGGASGRGEDTENKAIVLAGHLMGYTGFARLGGLKTEQWVVEKLGGVDPPSYL